MKKIDNLKIEPVVNANDFIGISINNGQITIKTPLCFRIDEDDKILKKKFNSIFKKYINCNQGSRIH